MAELKKCSKCNGEMVQCSFESFPMNVKSISPKLYVNKTTEIIPYVCLNCGFTDFYAKDPNRLL